MTTALFRQLRVLLADGQAAKLDEIARVVARLGHVVVAKETNVAVIGALSETEPADVAIVVVGESSEHALDLVGSLVRQAVCPVIAVLDVEDAAFVREAAKRGLFAYIAGAETTDDMLASAIEVVLLRFAEYHALEGAFGRRALTERAKGILMERHAVSEEAAFRMLRDEARRSNAKLIDVARAVVDARALLPSQHEQRD